MWWKVFLQRVNSCCWWEKLQKERWYWFKSCYSLTGFNPKSQKCHTHVHRANSLLAGSRSQSGCLHGLFKNLVTVKCKFSMWSHRYGSGHLRLVQPFSQTFSGIQSKLSGPGLSGCPVISGSQTLDSWDLIKTRPSLLFRFPRRNQFIRTRTAEARSGSRGHSHRSALSQVLDHFIASQFLKIATSDYNSRITWTTR